MSASRRRLALALIVVGALAAGAGIVAWHSGWWRDEPVIAGDERISVETALSPRTHMFGDSVIARVDLVFSRVFLAVESIHVRASFAPFRVEAAGRTRSDHGDTTRLTLTYRLVCLRNACLARAGEQRVFSFPEAIVSYTFAGGGTRQRARVRWPDATAGSRLSAGEFARPSLRASLRPLPAPTYRVPPDVLAALSLVGAFVLLLVASALLVPQLPRSLGLRVPGWARRHRRQQTPLELALARVRATGSNGAGHDARRALEALALELALSGRSDLAGDARRLAWSAERPAANGIGELETEVERVIETAR
ncbi:MAG: hypothetical protein ABR583_05255 [Gaiellaceae bacterium]